MSGRRHRGSGTVSPRKNKKGQRVSWRIIYYDRRGKKREETASKHLTKTEAKEVLRQRAAEALLDAEGVTISADRTTVELAAAAFFKYKTGRNADTTIALHRRIYRLHIEPFLAKELLADLDEHCVGEWMGELKRRRIGKKRLVRSVHLIAKAERLLTTMVRLAARHGHFGPRYSGGRVNTFSKPWAGLEWQKPRSKRRPAVRSASEIGNVVQAAADVGGRRLALACSLALFAGSRRGELPHMHWGEDLVFLDDEGGACAPEKATRLRVLVRPEYAKDKEFRVNFIAAPAIVRLAAEYAEEQRQWLEENPCLYQGHVFQATRTFVRKGVLVQDIGGAVRRVVKHGKWKRVKERAALPMSFRFHDLRGSFAKNLIGAGISITEVADAMGHASTDTTMVYLRESGGQAAQRASDALAELGSGQMSIQVPDRKPAKRGAPGTREPLRPCAKVMATNVATVDPSTPHGRIRITRVKQGIRQKDIGALCAEYTGTGDDKSWQQKLSRMELGKWYPKTAAEARAVGRAISTALRDESLAFAIAAMRKPGKERAS